jgi:hypothetical protein
LRLSALATIPFESQRRRVGPQQVEEDGLPADVGVTEERNASFGASGLRSPESRPSEDFDSRADVVGPLPIRWRMWCRKGLEGASAMLVASGVACLFLPWQRQVVGPL